MKRLLDYVSPWALAGVAVWLVMMVTAYNWAIPIYANVGSHPETFSVTQPDTTIFAIVVASIVTVILAGIVVLARRVARPE